MTKHLNDNRTALAMTSEEADNLFQKIAQETIIHAAAQAKFEKQLANVKEASDHCADEFKAVIAPLENKLAAYINAHPERFKKPRMRKTIWGSYGLRSVSKLEITDEASLIAAIKANNVEALITKVSIDKKAVEQAISNGIDLEGAEIRCGEVAKYDVEKKLMSQDK